MVRKDTKGRIVETAVRLFNESGSAAVSTNHIAEEAGISPGNLYYHFRNKEEIIREILRRMILKWGEVWVLPPDAPPELSGLRAMLDRNVALQWEYRFFYREILALMRRDPELQERYQTIQRERLGELELFFQSIIEAGIMREPDDSATLPALVKAAWIVANGWLSFLESGGEPVEPASMSQGTEVLVRIFRPYLTEEALRELYRPEVGSQQHRRNI